MSCNIKSFKLCVVGETSVGKTSFIERITTNSFIENHVATIGMDFSSKTIARSNNKKIKLSYWDTAGQERFRSIASVLYKDKDGILLLYKITDRTTFLKVNSWLAQVKENVPVENPLILLGNQRDMNDDREVTEEEGKALAKENNIPFYEISAKTGDNIKEVEMKIVEMLEELDAKDGRKDREKRRGKSLYDVNRKNDKKCCK